MVKIRVGMGYDVHRLVEGRELWLGGIRINHAKGLLGHSDADVLIHAICDALLGAADARDIGFHFPDTAQKSTAKFFCATPLRWFATKALKLVILMQQCVHNNLNLKIISLR